MGWTRPTWCRHEPRIRNRFHICVDLRVPEPVITSRPKVRRAMGPMTEAQREQIRAAAKKRWDAFHEKNADRDADIRRKKEKGYTNTSLAEEYDITPTTVARILERTPAAG